MALAVLAGLASTPALGGKLLFRPNEQPVSPEVDMIDAEYSQSRAEITWVDYTGHLWIGKIDPDTGFFNPISGKSILVDPDSMSTTDLEITYNGPEWVSTADGDQIVYTKFLAGQPHIAANGRLALAQSTGNDVWSYGFLDPDNPRLGPYASDDEGDTQPRITYMDNFERHLWRYLNDPTSEGGLPLPPSAKSVRLVKGAHAVIYANPVDGVNQLFIYYLDLNKIQQLTFDSGSKDIQTVPWMWPAPEYGGDYVVSTVVDNSELRIYHGTNSTGTFTLADSYYSMALPANSKIASPEPFVYNGSSYLFMAMTTAPNEFPSSIWIANINPLRPLFRQISDDSVLRVRTDPEVFITTKGPYIYYNGYDPTVDPGHWYCGKCSQGIFRAYTGLGN